MAHVIRINDDLKTYAGLEVCRQLNEAIDEEKICLDISDLGFTAPLGTAMVGAQIRRLQDRGVRFSVRGYSENKSSHSYLGHLGFFKLMKIDLGNKPGEALGSDAYLPLTVLNKSDLEMDEILTETSVQEAVRHKAKRLATVLLQDEEDEDVLKSLSYCFTELIRNVFEHAGTDECIFMAQAYRDGRVSIGVVDGGRGLKQSLRERHTIENDMSALQLAIKPGISRQAINAEDQNPWANSGFGLYVLSQLGKKCGRFDLVSGRASTFLMGSTVRYEDVLYRGTAVGITFDNVRATNLQAKLQTIIAAGEVEARSEGRPVRASRSSHDFS